MKLLLVLLLLSRTIAQPCSNPVAAVTSPIQGSCVADNTQTYIYTSTQLGTLQGLQAFTVTIWFRPDQEISGRTEQALFRMTAASSDVINATPDGVRLGLYYTANSDQSTSLRVQYSKLSNNAQSFTQALPYIAQHWIFAVAGLDYNQGKISYYAWQPFSPSVQVNPQPVQEAVNFNTALNSISQLELLYYGASYTRYCGSINSVNFYPNYLETGYLHNWLNLAFYSTTYAYQVAAYYKFEDQNGQLLRDSSGLNTAGCLGSTVAVAANDPTFTAQELQFSTGQFATLPGVKLASTNLAYGYSFYFKTSAIITSDADSGDLTKDLVLLKRWYQGTSDIFGIMIYTASSNQYATKIKLHGVLYSLGSVLLSTNTWHFVSVRVAYPNAVTELTNIIFDVVLENSIFAAHRVTTLTNTYLESASDYITVGSSLNGFSGTLLISNVQLYTTYNSYIIENSSPPITPIQCNTNCQTSLNSPSYSQCLYCLNSKYLSNGQCIAACVAGPTALTDSNTNVCKNCPYQCATCQTNGNCNTCNVGYYLQNTNIACVVSASCAAGMVGDPSTLLCSFCGNGAINAPEACDDGNFVSGDGCSHCTIDTNYVCNNAIPPSVCQLRCGDGVIQAGFGEQCDDGNQISNDGCSSCQVDTGYKCTGTPSICKLLCGNGVRENAEMCDDGNNNNYDGCSSTCLLEPGYACAGITPDVCTKLCGNGVVDFGEECDDGNNIAGDGCTNCVVDQGSACPLNVCHKVCGNGVRDLGENCDNGVKPPGTGCTTCLVDIDYICVGGTSTTPDICKVIPDICGDGIKKSSEQCDDGNTVNGDGCSQRCQIEIGFTCSAGSQYAISVCYEICGDGRRVGQEQCDDNNIFGGDGCNERCFVEPLYQCKGGTSTSPDICVMTCGNGIRDPTEDCDDNNLDSGDGCSSSCTIESGWGCMTSQSGQRDQCFQCIPGCATCLDTTALGCSLCFQGFYLHVGISSCLAGCPAGHYADHSTYQCTQCLQGCSRCQFNQLTQMQECLQCQYNYYAFLSLCFPQCPSGYYNLANVMQGNTCQACTYPCSVCTSSTSCQQCGNGYYMNNKGVCQQCGMGDQCLVCNYASGRCLECEVGYYRKGASCIKMPQVCGDGYHHPLEICDDGNLQNGDGCSPACRLELNWDCILLDSQGPDVCFKEAPPLMTTSISYVQYNRLYLEFSRPLQSGINFTNITVVTIPALDDPNFRLMEPPNAAGIVIVHDKSNLFIPYEYTISQIDSMTVEINFDYRVTVQNLLASINITSPELVVDVYNWTLQGKQQSPTKRLLQDQSTYKSINGSLQYYIYYSPNEQLLIDVVAWLMFAIVIIGLGSSAYYAYQIGEGRNWKLIEIVQTISILRFLNWRYSNNLEMMLLKLDYLNGTFIFNIFTLFLTPQDTDTTIDGIVKFQIMDYGGEFFFNGGGRFISWLAYLMALLFINEILYRIIKFEALEYYTEIIHKFFVYQGFIKFVELLYYDLVTSIMLQLRLASFSTFIQALQFALALVFLLVSVILIALVVKKFVLNKDLTKVEQFYDQFGTLFDGISFDEEIQKVFTIIPYAQKILIAIILVFLQNPSIQVLAIIAIRLSPHVLVYWHIPFYYVQIYLREIVYESFLVLFLVTTFTYLDFNGSKSQKQANGWGLMSIIVAMIIAQCFWVKWAYDNIDKMSPPPVPEHLEVHDEKEEEEEQLKSKIKKPKKKAVVSVLEQENKMQEMEQDFFGSIQAK